MQDDLIQKARAGRKSALMSVRSNRDLGRDLVAMRRLPALSPKAVGALFDSTQLQFHRSVMRLELQTV